MVIVSPIFHGTGLATYLIGATLGNKIVTTRRFKPEGTLKLIADHKADMLVAVPTMLHRIVELGPDVIATYDTSSLKTIAIAGSALTPELSNRVQDTFGDVLYNIYASTECGFATIATPDELRRAPGTAGRSPVGCEVVLFDEHDQRVHGANKRGRIFIRSGGAFRGVHRRPEQAGHRRLHVQWRHGPLRRERVAVRRRARRRHDRLRR